MSIQELTINPDRPLRLVPGKDKGIKGKPSMHIRLYGGLLQLNGDTVSHTKRCVLYNTSLNE